MTLDDIKASYANFLTIKQVADASRTPDGRKLDERTVRRACEDGQIPCVRFGRRILVPRLAFIALLEGGVAHDAAPGAGA